MVKHLLFKRTCWSICVLNQERVGSRHRIELLNSLVRVWVERLNLVDIINELKVIEKCFQKDWDGDSILKLFLNYTREISAKFLKLLYFLSLVFDLSFEVALMLFESADLLSIAHFVL